MMRVIHEVVLAHPKNGDRVYARAYYQQGRNFIYEYRHSGINRIYNETSYRDICIFLRNVQNFFEDKGYKLLVKYQLQHRAPESKP